MIRVEYWDPSEFDCPLLTGSALSDGRTLHLHVGSDEEVIQAYLTHVGMAMRSTEGPGGSIVGSFVGQRYCCIRGPGGLLRRLVETEE